MTLSLIVGLLVAFDSKSSTLDSGLDEVALQKRIAQSSIRVLNHFDLALQYEESTGYLGFTKNISGTRNVFSRLSPVFASEEVILFFIRNQALALNDISPNSELQITVAALSGALLQAETTGNDLFKRESLFEILKHLATLRAQMKRISERST